MFLTGQAFLFAKPFRATLILLLPMVFVGCGAKKDDKPASQTAAKVNRAEITVHQIQFLLQQRAPTEQTDAAKHDVLERLINQELTIQRAKDLKLERDAKVMQQIDAAQREIIARAYIDRIVNSASEPTAEEVRQYYEKHPALFKERKIYKFQELNITAEASVLDGLKASLASAKNANAIGDLLKNKGVKFSSGQIIKGAEQLPINSIDTYASLKEGQNVITPTPAGLQVLVLLSAQTQPVSEEQARPAIEQFILKENKRKVIESDLKALKENAKIEYIGDFDKNKDANLEKNTN